MSDFLSNFNSNNYDKKIREKEENNREKTPENKNTVRPTSVEPENTDECKESRAKNNHSDETIEIDPTYKKKKKRQKKIFVFLGIIACLIIAWIYYSVTHVTMPDLVNGSVSNARVWAEKNKMTLDIKQIYSLKYETNQVLKQEVPKGNKVKRGSVLIVTASKGPNPNEKVALPDFSTLTKKDVEAFIKENKLDNVTILTKYNDTVEKGKYLSQEFSSKEITEKNYRRKDGLIIYYSNGKETFEKNISVPDFKGKAKSEVESWAKTNDIQIKYEESDSNEVEAGMVISQSVAKETKIAKKEQLSVTISQGKAVVVPNFVEISPENAETIQSLSVQKKFQFAQNIPYGQLISQSIPAGTKLLSKDSNSIVVVYSSGRPYLKSYIGKIEGDLPQAFYEDYQSKGANIRYTVHYVDSGAEKGTVVDMSAYNQYVGLDFVVDIGISKGNLASPDNLLSPSETTSSE